MLSDHQHHGLA